MGKGMDSRKRGNPRHQHGRAGAAAGPPALVAFCRACHRPSSQALRLLATALLPFGLQAPQAAASPAL